MEMRANRVCTQTRIGFCLSPLMMVVKICVSGECFSLLLTSLRLAMAKARLMTPMLCRLRCLAFSDSALL